MLRKCNETKQILILSAIKSNTLTEKEEKRNKKQNKNKIMVGLH